MMDDVLFECDWCDCDDCGGDGSGFLGRVCALDGVGVAYFVFSLY